MAYRGDTGDPYVDPQTGILINLAGIRDAALLEEYEGEMSIIRQFELSENPLPPSFDLAHLRAIHRHLFQDVYAWAGELRTVDMAKGNSRFGSHLHIANYLFKAFLTLSAERDLWRDGSPTTSAKSMPPTPFGKEMEEPNGFSSGCSPTNAALKSGGTG
jgi:fido (protein-threonine AMPylation protein)